MPKDKEQQKLQNSVLLELPKETDALYNFIFSGDLKIEGASKNWEKYLPEYENQKSTPFCTTYSAHNCIEAYLKSKDINVNFSDRYTAVKSGTKQTGNYLSKVANSIRNNKICEEKDCEFSEEMLTNPYNDEIWKKIFNLPKDIEKKAITYFDKHIKEINYSWVRGHQPYLKAALEYTPLQVAFGVNNTYFDEIATPVNEFYCFHAAMLYHIDEEGYYYIYDSLFKEKKKLAPEYPFTAVMSFRPLPNDWREIQKEQIKKKITNNYEKKLMMNAGNGSMGIIIDKKLKEIDPSRSGQAALYVLINNGFGLTITEEIFNELIAEGEDKKF